ncbi:hypothetical protein ZWY2020_007751 [Hordeum vulgare]|nr:hypothetical protein ZWY2020_007751 [Hordeum vulgare]
MAMVVRESGALAWRRRRRCDSRTRRRVATAVRCGPHGHRPPKLFLGDGTVEVLEISIPTDTVRVNSRSIALSPAVGAPVKKANGVAKYHTWSGFRRGGQFFVSPEKNKFLVLSCSNVQVLLVEDSITVNAYATYCPPAQEKGQPFSVPPEQGVLRHWLLQCCHPQRLHFL